MKNTIVLLLAFLAVFGHGYAQRKVERYCTVYIQPRDFENSEQRVSLSLGRHPEYFLFKDTLVMHDLLKVNEMRSTTDVLNYMASMGWAMVGNSTFPGRGYWFISFYFKREFDLSELANN